MSELRRIQGTPASDRMADPEASPAAAGTFHPASQSLNDPDRLEALRRSKLLDGASNPALDRLTRIASALLNVPVSLVSLVDNAGQHFPGLTGLGGWAGDRRGTALSHSFCQHVVTSNAPLVIENSQDSSVVADNLAIPRLGVVAYAGVPLRTGEGHTLGALCAIDGQPKAWTADEIAILEDVAKLAMAEIDRLIALGAERSPAAAVQDTHDVLTGLFNSRGFLQRGSELDTDLAPLSHPFSIVSLDVDGFAAFNTQFGYDAGNNRLLEVGGILVQLVGRQAVVARTGVDEFAVLLLETDAEGAVAFVELLGRMLQVRNAAHNDGVSLALSAGSATSVTDSRATFAQVLKKAEIAMYRTMDARVRPTTAKAG